MNSRLGRVSSVVVLSGLVLLLVASGALAQPRHERVRLPYWRLSDGSVQTSSVHQQLTATADRLLVGLTPVEPVLMPVPSRRLPRNASRIAAAAGGRLQQFLTGGSLAVVDLPAGSDLHRAADALLRAGALFAEPDYEVHLSRIPNDPRYPDQYHHPQINSPGGWDITIGSRDVVIAVVDSGVDLLHPDLADSIWINPAEIAGNGNDDDNNGYVDDWRGWDFYEDTNNPRPKPDGKDNDGSGTPDDQVSHGTLVAGLAAAIGNDRFGTVGVSWRATVMALKVFPDDGTTSVATVVEAIDYAVDNGADIINLSIGAPYTESFSPPINRAYQSGIVVVAAAGNGGAAISDSKSSWVSPVCNVGPNWRVDNYVLGVAAVDRQDKRGWYTNYDISSASFVDVCAPGTELFGPVYFDETGQFPHLQSHFGTNTGTSFAAPLVSGLAALILANNPQYSPSQVYRAIRTSTDNIDQKNPGYEGTLGTGRINCGRALGQVVPPSPVTGFQAFDTPDDDGGSITLTWTKSADDGGGANSVTGYVILRRQGSSGSFQQIATLPPGTTRYDDTGVSDGVPYYYIVRTTDGTLTSDSPTVGPVESRNDGAPPVVENLLVMDRPDDDGGAITLDWSDYISPSDFASYRIYRHNRAFTSTVGIPVVNTISDPAAKRWVDESVQDGVDYHYAVGVRDVASNEERNIRSVGPVQSYPNNNITFGPGLLFMGPAAVPPDRDPATLLNIAPAQLKAARWDPVGSPPYVTYVPGAVPELLRLALGRGFWVWLDQPTVIQPVGETAPAGDFSINLGPGWHQLANPFFSPLDFGASTVTYGSNTMDLLSAERAGVMRAVAWTYSPTDQQYVMAYPDLGQNPSMIAPWTGFWVQVLKSCTLTLVRSSGGTVTSAGTENAPWGQGWKAQVMLRVGAGAAASGMVGTAQTDYCLPAPPPIGARPQLRLSAANRDEAVSSNAVSLGADAAGRWTWNVDVTNLPPNTEVEVAMPDLSGLPPEYTAILHDPLAGKSTYLRTAAAYRFISRTEAERRLQLSVQSRSAGPLLVSTLSTQPAPGGSVQMVFSLSQPAHTSVEVLNIAGRPVRVVEQQHLRLAGNHTIVFDGRNSHGAAVPGGRYLAVVTAIGDDGQQVRQMTTFNLSR